MKEILKTFWWWFLAIFVLFLFYPYVNWIKETWIPYCKKSEVIISDWGTCINWIQQREVRALNSWCRIQEEDYPKEQKCELNSTNTWEITSSWVIKNIIKRVYIFDWPYTTEVDIKKGDYSKSYNNFTIYLSGNIKSLNLNILWETQVNGWKRIFIPESYYFMFAIDDVNPRILGTTRKGQNRIDTSWFWVFKGTTTPKRLSFNLSKDIQLASTSSEFLKWINSINKNYLELLNKNSWKKLSGTLLMWDWNSMLEPDIFNRIFWVITEAYFEYECTNWDDCLITLN